MNVKKILSLAVVLAMVLTVVPTFGVFAAPTADATSWKVTFNTPAKVTGYGDVQILDTDGDVVTGFCIADDGIHPFHREQVKDKETSVADYNGTAPKYSNTPGETSVSYDANTAVEIAYEKVESGYKVTYTVKGGLKYKTTTALEKDFVVSRTYTTDVEINGVSAPNSWWINNWGNNITINNSNIATEYILNAKVDGQDFTAPEKAAITVKHIAEDGTVVKDEVAVNDLYVGGRYEVKLINPMIIEKNGVKYLPAKDTPKTVLIKSLQKTNDITFNYAKVDGFKAVEVPKEATIDYKKYSIKGTNLVDNPSFETSDGRFTIEGWNSPEKKATFGASGNDHGFAITKTEYSGVNGLDNPVATDAYPPQDGEAAFGGRWNDGEKGLCSIYKNTTVEKNKTYYVSYWVRANDCNEGRAQVLAVNGNADPSGTKAAGNVISTAKYGNWTKVETIVSTGDNDTIQFHAWRLGSGDADGNGNAGSHPYIMFDNFVIAEAEFLEEAKDTTVNYKVGDKTVKTVTEKGFGDDEVTFDAFEIYVDGAVYTAEAQTLKGGGTRDVVMTAVEGRTYPTLDVFASSGDAGKIEDKSGDMIMVATVNDYAHDRDYDGNPAAGNMGNLGSVRAGILRFNKPAVAADQQVLLKVFVGQVNENVSNNGIDNGTKLYAFKYDGAVEGAVKGESIIKDVNDKTDTFAWSDVQAKTNTQSGQKRPCNMWLTMDVTDIVKAASGDTVTIALGAARAGVYVVDSETASDVNSEFSGKVAYLTVVGGQTVAIDGDTPAKVTKNGSVVNTPVVAQEGDTIRAYDDEGSMLVDGAVVGEVAADTTSMTVTAVPIEISLGYDGENLAIVFDGTDGIKAVVTNNANDLNEETVMPVAVVPANANVTYTVTLKDEAGTVIKSKAQALYPLVVTDITANLPDYQDAEKNLARVEAAVKALTEGGLNYIAAVAGADGAEGTPATIGAGRDKFITVTENEDKSVTIAIDDALYRDGKGMGFKAGVKAGADTVVEATGAEGTVFKSVTIDAEGKTATVQAADGSVYTFSLDSVEIEFVETEIAETEGADAEAEADFIPEL